MSLISNHSPTLWCIIEHRHYSTSGGYEIKTIIAEVIFDTPFQEYQQTTNFEVKSYYLEWDSYAA